MILVDTSVWVDHFRGTELHLQDLLRRGEVAIHPFIVGELACGNLSNRTQILELLQALPQSTCATHDEVLAFIDRHGLFGRGLGFVDIRLLASSLLSHAPLWSFDRKLRQMATALHTAYKR